MTTRARTIPAAIDMPSSRFRELGHKLVDDLADLLENLPKKPVAPGKRPSAIRAFLPADDLPEAGEDPHVVLHDAVRLLSENSTFNGHPRFLGYITASAAPIGILGDFLAATINPNVGGWALSPAATEIELQTIRWMAELTGFPRDCGGIFVSGGNMANMVAFFAARAKAARETPGAILRCYGSVETHTWIEKAVDLSGLGDDSFHRLEVDGSGRVRADDLREAIESDRARGFTPFLVIATAGTTNIGATDPILEIADICDEAKVWLHADGAYGAPAATLPDASPDLKAISRASSLAIDPHKWLYAPLEAGCTLVRDREDLLRAFSHTPHYYHFDDIEGERGLNFYEHGPQNSRGFRALKVWLAMRHVGRSGYQEMIAQDMALATEMYDAVSREPELEPFTCALSIVTFRFVPEGIAGDEYLNRLNEELLSALQNEGEVFLSNATVDGKFLLRACIVNFRTTLDDVRAVPEIVVRTGRRVHAQLVAGTSK